MQALYTGSEFTRLEKKMKNTYLEILLFIIIKSYFLNIILEFFFIFHFCINILRSCDFSICLGALYNLKIKQPIYTIFFKGKLNDKCIKRCI